MARSERSTKRYFKLYAAQDRNNYNGFSKGSRNKHLIKLVSNDVGKGLSRID